jgi:hypothetical protein
VKVPVPRLVECTVTVEADPAQGDVADGDVKLLILGVGFTVKAAVLDDDIVLLHDELLLTAVRVTVVDPVDVSFADEMVKVPVDEPMVNVAVLPVELLAPLRL